MRSCAARYRVSISGEKPIPWRHSAGDWIIGTLVGFNLRREANPLATCGLAALACLPWRFQSQARSQSPGDLVAEGEVTGWSEFQSQARSQSPGDHKQVLLSIQMSTVSISGEKPIPWRRMRVIRFIELLAQFQSQARSQSPGDLEEILERKRKGFPFQSQARSQSPGDLTVLSAMR